MSAPWWWSWLLTAVGVTGVWLIGSRRRVGFAVGVGAQGLWIAYSVVTAQYGFIIASLLYAAMYARGYRRWRSAEDEER